MPHVRCTLLVLSFSTLLFVALPLRADGDPNAVSFEKDVLPLLQQNCFRCHDARKKTADLRLDVRKLAYAGGESKKPSIVPGKPDQSELYLRLVSDDEDLQMPPGGEKLPAEQIRKVKAWIIDGAKWPDALANEEGPPPHWAFQPVKRPSVPNEQNAVHPIDAFVQAKLAEKKLTPARPADPVTLLRRVYLDLIGLPPTPEQVDQFVSKPTPEHYREIVEELLASPHYGERWGRLWLDAARYADSDGFEKDKPRFVHFYRDYVVNAHNQDMPYDQFLIEQLAGDLLPNRTQDQLVATGFLRNSMINEEGGADPEQFRMEAMFDRLDTIGKSILGLTIGCAQCHTHKYDPISHTEYFQLFALFNNAHEASVTVYTPEQQRIRATLFNQMKTIHEQIKHKNPDWPERLARWEANLPKVPQWTIVRPELDGSGGQKHLLQPDGSILAAGYAPTKHTTDFTIIAPADLTVQSIRLELLNDPTLPHGGPGRSVAGTFALTEFKAKHQGKALKIAKATANRNAAEHPLPAIYADKTKRKRLLGPIDFAIDGKDETAWCNDIGPGRRNGPCEAVFVLAEPILLKQGESLTFSLVQNHGGWNSDDNQTLNLGRFRFSLSDDAAAMADPLPPTARAIVARGPAGRTTAEVDLLLGFWIKSEPQFKEEQYDLESLWKDHPEGTSQLILDEMPQARETRLLKRGEITKPAELVGPGTPAFLNPYPAGLAKNRLGFARWLTAPDAPTTARALVNRVWQAYFGRGFLDTPEDLGTQGSLPTHPELLDWLAAEFMQPTDPSVNPWSMKALHRLIVTSQTYQQDSTISRAAYAADPANLWLARGPRFRLEGELIRDAALYAAGLLNLKVGGEPVYPPLPEFLMLPPVSYGPKAWPTTTGAERYRRSLYVFRFRSVPYPALQAFDVPNGDTACVKRNRSNTPLQALVGLNEPMFLDASRGLARRMLNHAAASQADRLSFGFRLCLSRTPTDQELEVLHQFVCKQRERFAAELNAEEARALVGTAVPFPKDIAIEEAAAWIATARVLLNLDEMMTKE